MYKSRLTHLYRFFSKEGNDISLQNILNPVFTKSTIEFVVMLPLIQLLVSFHEKLNILFLCFSGYQQNLHGSVTKACSVLGRHGKPSPQAGRSHQPRENYCSTDRFNVHFVAHVSLQLPHHPLQCVVGHVALCQPQPPTPSPSGGKER